MIRIGLGYDVHQLVKGRKLILGGVTVPYKKGLKGHSDADVIVHAIGDALLGAASLGDIGQLFPNTDPQFKNISSITLLSRISKKLTQAQCRIGNIDAMLLAEEPKISPFIEQMRKNIAGALGLDRGCISLKATTNEKLGFIGQKKGMAAYAVCLIEQQKQN